MTATASIILTGKSKSDLLTEISGLKAWMAPYEHDVFVSLVDCHFGKIDSLSNLEKAVNEDLGKYIIEKFPSMMKKKVLKSGGNDDLYVVDDPDCFNEEGKPCRRNRGSRFTPKKKRRRRK